MLGPESFSCLKVVLDLKVKKSGAYAPLMAKFI